jgi:tRNA threonylcarbamoyladenosine biosynthesis protein TsaB
MIDARRMEVYTAVYHTNLIVNQETNAQIISESSFLQLLKNNKLAIFGNGSEKCKSVITHPNASFFANVDCCASGLISIAQKRFSQNEFVNLAYFEPFYLKDFIPTTPKK